MFQFAQPITQLGGVTVKDAAANNVGNVYYVMTGSSVQVVLVGIADAKRVTVTLTGVNGTPLNPAAAIGFLVGDVNGNGAINASDIGAVKARIGQTLSNTTFKYDLNASGSISATDVSMVKARAGISLP